MIRATSLGGYPERMPFSSFNHSFRCLLKNKEFIIKNSEEKEENNNNSIDERENVRRILKRAGIAEHRFRLGLSQILLQRELLEELENKRSVVLLPLLSEFQANCRKYLTSKRMQNEREKVEAIRIIQWNFERWKDLKKSEWWKLFVNIRPLIPVSSADARERRLREHLAQLELELDELRSEHSRAQLELESALKSKQIAEKWSEEIGQRNKKLIVELEEAEEKLKKSVKTSEQLNGTTPNGIKQMPTAFEWENDPRTVELRKQLNDALDRERTFQHKVQKTTDELLDARAEIDVINAKNERLEKRLKNSNDELINLREQLDQSMDHRETLERQQFELNLKESRKRAELQRELEAKEDEMEEMRIQYQRKIRNLESALDDAQIENSSLKQKKAAWQRNSQSASMNGSLLDLAQNTSTENRTLRRKLAKALSLLQNSQINFDKDSFEGNSQLRKQNLGSTVFSSVCGGSEFDDLEDMLLEEDGKDLQKEEGNISILKPKEERGSRETSLLAIENDGANSDTVEDSSCGAEEMPASSNNIN